MTFVTCNHVTTSRSSRHHCSSRNSQWKQRYFHYLILFYNKDNDFYNFYFIILYLSNFYFDHLFYQFLFFHFLFYFINFVLLNFPKKSNYYLVIPLFRSFRHF
ncbi:hypothetical protein RhiirC2_197264 [Rhizophagus irregularis]|uniref:Uncharacterized protein n=1 Tax=Rhizophagus irregularis TaxID=588596 RepID=A0A2N1NQ70_9GLOM|nr:hypothetical protein RhiirC2_197264 [Rhizophagus irregularis]